MPVARELGTGFLAYSPLGRGVLTGSVKKPEDLKGYARKVPRYQEDNFDKVCA